ncbi:hypothetical protein TNCV_2951821 [Trichonephila clavipes]|nr:hypothetical protein TNCV_2951821 [Trichonephila clavipes]
MNNFLSPVEHNSISQNIPKRSFEKYRKLMDTKSPARGNSCLRVSLTKTRMDLEGKKKEIKDGDCSNSYRICIVFEHGESWRVLAL